MIHIRNRNDLLAWLEENASSKAIHRALLGGTVELFGAFDPVPGSLFPGWIIKIKFKSYVYVIIIVVDIVNGRMRNYRINLKDIKWKNWNNSESKYHLYCGDSPLLYKELQENER